MSRLQLCGIALILFAVFLQGYCAPRSVTEPFAGSGLGLVLVEPLFPLLVQIIERDKKCNEDDK